MLPSHRFVGDFLARTVEFLWLALSRRMTRRFDVIGIGGAENYGDFNRVPLPPRVTALGYLTHLLSDCLRGAEDSRFGLGLGNCLITPWELDVEGHQSSAGGWMDSRRKFGQRLRITVDFQLGS